MSSPAPYPPDPDETIQLTEADLEPQETAPPRPTGLLALLLDPRGLQWLMGAGGGLLVIGLVAWLAAVGLFDNPLHVAFGMGLANIALLGAGCYVAAKTRYQLAGRAVAMLACLLLPLHLWFYDAQGLLTLSQGGNLWVPALVCCLIYAGVARWLKDAVFVYPVVGGVALTGLLFLADADVERFWEVVAPSMLLVIVGAVCIHVQRLFPVGESDDDAPGLTRETFGRAFFQAGQVALASGLAILFAGRFAGRFYANWFAELDWFALPDVSAFAQAKLAALGLTCLAAYTYGYCWWTVGGARRWATAMLAMGAWSVVIVIDLFGVPITEQLVVGVLALVSIGCQVLDRWLVNREGQKAAGNSATIGLLGQATGWLALVALLGQLGRGLYIVEPTWLVCSLGWEFAVAAAMVLVAHIAIQLFRSETRKQGEPAPLIGVGLASLVLVAALVHVIPAAAAIAVGSLLAILAAVPITLTALMLVARDAKWRRDAMQATNATGLALTMLSVPAFFLAPSTGMVVLYGLLAAMFGVVAARGENKFALPSSVLLAIAAMGQAVFVYQLELPVPFVIISLVGLAITAVDRVRPLANGWAMGQFAVVLSGVAGGLLATNRLLGGDADVPLLLMLVTQATTAFVAAWVAAPQRGRRGLLIVALFSSIMAGVTINAVSELAFGQRVELLAIIAGVALLVVAHVAWRRESEDRDQSQADSVVDVTLWVGTLLATVPMGIGLIVVRLLGGNPAWIAMHEVGGLAIGLALVATGVLCRFRATTLGGAGLLATYLLSLLTMLHLPEQLQTTAVYLMVGGGICFGGALLLSVYRDRLLAIPRRVREGEGVFAVLKWR